MNKIIVIAMTAMTAMTAMATVLESRGAAFAHEYEYDSDETVKVEMAMHEHSQHDLAMSKQDALKRDKMKKRGMKVSLDAVVDFHMAVPTNDSRYEYSTTDAYVNRLYDLNGLIKNPSLLITTPFVVPDHDGAILGDYREDYYYNLNSLLNIKIERDVTRDISVGALFEVLTPVSSDRVREYSFGAKNKGVYIFLDHKYLKAQVGAMVGAEQMMKIDPAQWSAADGGVASGWINYANLEGNYVDAVVVASPDANKSTRHRDVMRPFYITPALYSQYVSNNATYSRDDKIDIGIAPKISVYSHNINGVQLGASFTPHQIVGDGSMISDPYYRLRPAYENVFAAGVRYEKYVSNYMIQLAMAGEVGSAVKGSNQTSAAYNDLSAVSIGGLLKYSNCITFGGEYGYLGKSGTYKKVLKDEDLNVSILDLDDPDRYKDADPEGAYYWTIGAAYDAGPARISAGYYEGYNNIHTTNSDDRSKMSDLNIGADYNSSYGSKHTKLSPYVSYHHFTTKERGVPDNRNNKGDLFLVGVKAIF